MGAVRENWAKSCAEHDIEVWKMEEYTDIDMSMYLTKRHITYGINEDMLGTAPMWQIWIGDDRVFTSTSIENAYIKWKEIVRKHRE